MRTCSLGTRALKKQLKTVQASSNRTGVPKRTQRKRRNITRRMFFLNFLLQFLIIKKNLNFFSN
jgi:hypothetical protein